ncbi:MAG: hypothetical protein FJ279_37290 [Planctomycetes bacterium]|nr:hypothetical protein [Planctomycetota bacterium]
MAKLGKLAMVVGMCAFLSCVGPRVAQAACEDLPCGCCDGGGDPVFVLRDQRDLAGLALARVERQKKLAAAKEVAKLPAAGKAAEQKVEEARAPKNAESKN